MTSVLLRIALPGAVLFAPPSPALAGPAIFVNELHYDNSGPDIDEAVEIAGPALTNLNGWSVVLYNGTGGAAYETIPLSGYLSNQCDGFGTVVVPATGIQNGAPDGLALVNGSTVVQFLSYEGTFTASSGPAAGLTSTSIGVSENGSAPASQSLRLAGWRRTSAGNPLRPRRSASATPARPFSAAWIPHRSSLLSSPLRARPTCRNRRSSMFGSVSRSRSARARSR
jgi:hypothetical protein